MRTSYKIIFSTILLSTTACSTLNESVKLGATIGAATGAAATYSGFDSAGERPPSEKMILGTAIGLTLGVITSYYTHKNIEEKRQSIFEERSEMYFGDLPPSPFIVPQSHKKRGR